MPAAFRLVRLALAGAATSVALDAAISGQPAFDAIRTAMEPRPESLVGIGVDTATGAQTLTRVLLPYDAGQPLALTLRYDSTFSGVAGPLGRGWRHDHQATIEAPAGGDAVVTWGGHFRQRYRLVETSASQRRYASEEIAARRDDLVVQASGTRATLTRGDGTAYEFTLNNGTGSLVEVRNKVGQAVELFTTGGTSNQVARSGLRARITGAEIGLRYDAAGRLDYLWDAQAVGARYVDLDYDTRDRLVGISQPVTFSSPEHRWSSTNLTAPAGAAAGESYPQALTQAAPVGLVRITAGTVSTGRAEDVELRLVSPRGTTATIFNRVADPTVTRDLAQLGTLTTAFAGENASGTWRLIVISHSATTSVRVTSFAIRFSSPPSPTVYSYDASDRLAAASDPAGRLFRTTYDAAGRVTSQDDGRDDNALLRFAYEERSDDTLRTTVTDRVDQVSSFIHDARYRLLRWTDALGQAVSYTYDARGNRLSRTSPLGRTTRFEYDARHNLVSATDPASRLTLFQYDASRNLVSVLDARGTESRLRYDSRNNLSSWVDALGRTTSRSYNNNSQLDGVTLPDEGRMNLSYSGGGTVNFVGHPVNASRGTAVGYDEQGRMVSRTHADGGMSTFTYSPSGLLLREQLPDQRSRSYSYDERDRLLSETDLLGQTTRYLYDGNDNVVLMTNALGEQTRYSYDGEDRLVRTVDPLDQVQTVTYDAAGQVIARTDGLGRTTRFRFDADGNPIETEDPAGQVVLRQGYTARAELEREAGAFDHATDYTYDEAGNLSSAVDPAGRRVTYTYDTLNRHVALTDGANRTARQAYDTDGQIESLAGPAGQATTFGYDRANRLTRVTSGPRVIQFSYNERDLITEVNDGGRRFRHSYDNVGRRTRTEVLAPGAAAAERTLTHTFDPNGNLLGTADSRDGVAVRRTLDPLQRVSSFTDARGREVLYHYDAAGRLDRLTYPGGRAVTYGYDAAHQLTIVTDWAGRRTRLAYDDAGRVTRVEFPNGTYRVLTYDRAGRPLTRSDHQADGAAICSYAYEYAIDGRLETVSRTDRVLRYVPAAVSMTFDAANRITAYNGAPIASDLVGGLARAPTADGMASLTYDTRRRLTAIGGTSLLYDPEDRLVGWRNSGGETLLVVDPHAGLSRVLELAGPGGATTRYVYGIGLLYEETGSSIRVYHYDERGSTVALSGTAGDVVERYAYGPYGEAIGAVAPGATPFRFLGLYGVLTEPNGNCAMRSRVYSPFLRRFLSEDFYVGELAAPNSLNRYAYALGDPLSFEDPDGEFINVLIGAVTGAIGGVVAQGVSDLLQGRKPNWRDYVSAAAGGAVTGALIGSGVGAVFAGAGGGITQNFLDQSLSGGLTGEREFDFLSLGVAGALGGAGGAVGSKVFGPLKKGVNGAAGAAFRKQVVRNGVLYSSKRAALRAPLADVVKRTRSAGYHAVVGGAAVGALLAGGNQAALRLAAGPGDSVGAASPGVPATVGDATRYEQIRTFVEVGQRSRQGVQLHFSLYQTWLGAALVPLPNSPNAQPAAF